MEHLIKIQGRVITTALLFVISITLYGQSDSARLVHVGFVYPVSSNGLKASEYTNRLSLHAVAGVSKNETAFAIAGIANVIIRDANGAQIAGALNFVGNSARGAQIAGLGNIIKNEANGTQIAGFLNLAGTSGSAQIAGFGNISMADAKGVQIAGFINKGKNVDNQIAGVINIAGHVKGVQIGGFMNIAETSDYPIGILNFIKNGEKTIGISVDETLTSITSFRSGGRVLYGIVGAGYTFKDNGRSVYALEAGLGGHIPVINNFRINAEVVSQSLSDFKKGSYQKGTLRILPAYKIGRLELFAGSTLNYVQYEQDKGFDFVSKFIWSDSGNGDFQGLYLGFNGGIQLHL